MSGSPPGGLAQALASLSCSVDAAVHDLTRMIAIDTSFPPGKGYGRFAALMEQLVAPLGFHCRKILVPRELWEAGDGSATGDRINLVAERRTGKPACCLYFHVDTVPAGPNWSRAPLILEREGRRLYGLGAADMKGAMAAVLLALNTAYTAEVPLAYDPMLLFCTDEEGGLYPGIRYLAEQGFPLGHVLSFNGTAAPRIWAGCFGSINLVIRVHGSAAHAGDAAGINAFEAALPVMNALVALKCRVASRRSSLPPPPRAAPLAARLTLAAAHGGASGGTVPSRFDMLVNRRYAPEESFEEVIGEIRESAETSLADRGARLETMLVGHLPPVVDPVGPHWPRWQHALSNGFGWSPQEFLAWGATSSSDFGWVQRAGWREILLGGLGRPERNVHAAEEHTTVEDIVALATSVLSYLSAEFRSDIIPETAGSAS